jgi:hypothetical protein
LFVMLMREGEGERERKGKKEINIQNIRN